MSKKYKAGAKIGMSIQATFDVTEGDMEWLQIQSDHLTQELIKRELVRRERYLNRIVFFCNNGYFPPD